MKRIGRGIISSQWALFALGSTFAIGVLGIVTLSPPLGIGVFVLMIFGIWAFFKPHQTACVLAFLTAAFPKAGIKVGEFPFPIFLFGLLLAVALIAVRSKKVQHQRGTVLLLILFLSFIVGKALMFSSSGLSSVAAFTAWAAVPLLMLFIATRIDESIPAFRTSLEGGFLLAAAFGIVQLIVGIENSAIPGLTIAFGDSYASKNNGLSAVGAADFSKIPSTYQNGNIFGVVSAVFFVLALMRITSRTSRRSDAVLLIAAAASILMSGSRTAIVAAILGLLLAAIRRGSFGRKIGVVGVVVGGGVAAVQLHSGLVDRYSIGNLLASGGAGRTTIWRSAISELNPWEALFGTANYTVHEGWVGMVEQIGVLGILVLLATVIALTQRRTELRPVLVVVAICAVIDSSYLLFPTWFIPAALAVPSVANPFLHQGTGSGSSVRTTTSRQAELGVLPRQVGDLPRISRTVGPLKMRDH